MQLSDPLFGTRACFHPRRPHPATHPDSVPSEIQEERAPLHCYTQATAANLCRQPPVKSARQLSTSSPSRQGLQDCACDSSALPGLCQAAVQDMVLQLEDSAASRHGPAKRRVRPFPFADSRHVGMLHGLSLSTHNLWKAFSSTTRNAPDRGCTVVCNGSNAAASLD